MLQVARQSITAPDTVQKRVSPAGSERGARTNNTANLVHAPVNLLLADGVVATGVVVGRILLAAEQVLGVEEFAVGARPELVDGRRVQVEEDGPRDVFAVARLGEEGLVGAALEDVRRFRVRPAIGAEAVLQEVAAAGAVSAGCLVRGAGRTNSSQAELPSWMPAWPRWRWRI